MLHLHDPQTQNLELALYESAVHCPSLGRCAAAVAVAAALAPALFSCATLAQACARSCCCCSCSSSSSSHVCDKWLGPGRRDWKSPEKAEMTDSNGQNASVPQHSISTKAIALLVGARPTAPCASGALLSPMLSIRELQAPRPGM